MKKYLLLFLTILSFSGYAQNTINNYKYVLVPEKFSFLKQDDQYKLNSLSKRLLEDKGFTVYFDNADLPTEIANNKCTALNLEVTEKNSMFTTGLTILLKDCKGNVLFKGKEGKSREKDYEAAYNLATREAFKPLNEVQYAYTPAENAPSQEIVKRMEITVPVNQVAAQPITTEAPQAAGTLYAQPTANGYNLIDTAPKIVLTLLKTSAENYFIANNGSSNGIVFKRDENWFFEYYKNNQLVAEKLVIKF